MKHIFDLAGYQFKIDTVNIYYVLVITLYLELFLSFIIYDIVYNDFLVTLPG